jgi:hypothetical protein
MASGGAIPGQAGAGRLIAIVGDVAPAGLADRLSMGGVAVERLAAAPGP